ncbi:MAG TPA: hypothetical protein ENI27_04875 [bacterium]|nr:hypothetical protein [bacterium]
MTIRIIAEAGPNHNGSLERALEMVRVAKECGADTIKFQHIDPEHFPADMEWQGYNMRALFKDVRFSQRKWRKVMTECEKREIDFLCAPQTVRDFEDLLELGIKGVKVSSDNSGNLPLLKKIKESGIPAFRSLGMVDGETLLFLIPDEVYFVCTSEYPCPPESVNISRLHGMEPRFCGFSDHTQGNTAAVMAVALGAQVIEKHFTLDKSLEGPDHWWSADPEQLKSYIGEIRLAERMLGDGEFKPTEGELANMKLRGL